MENREIIITIILLMLSGMITFLYLMKNSAIYPDKPLLRDEDEKSLKYFIFWMLIMFLMVFCCYIYILSGYFKTIL
jgi:hypothetical protein